VIRGKVAVILQARIASQRLPGKVLEPVAGMTVLAHCVSRLRSSGVGPVVVATTTLDGDDAIAAEARELRVTTFRGDCDDVLGRFVGAAAAARAEFVIRATADNPAVDPDSAVRLIERLRASGADYAVEEALPHGCSVEAVRTIALRDAAARTHDPADREHVTTYLRRRASGFRCVTMLAPAHLRRPDLRFTVDTPADLAYMRRVLGEASAAIDRVAPLSELIAVADGLCRGLEVA
jgi:spore coat polysaccharide biosynthesis protein SpsF